MSHQIKPYHGAGVLLFRYNKEKESFEILLGKRSIRQGYGKWAIPGGGLEKKDTDYRACAFRELWEETGIDIKSIATKDLSQTRIDLPFFHWRTFLVMTWGELPPFRIREFSELRWIPLNEVRSYDLWISLSRELRLFERLQKPSSSESKSQT